MSDPVIVSGEFRTTANPKSTVYTGTTVVKTLQYASVDGYAIFEGDIILATQAEAERTQPEALEAVAIVGRRWPGGVIPFLIDPALPDPDRVTEAIAHWEEKTPIRFREKNARDTGWVRFRAGSGCSSFIGRTGGEQSVILGSGCTTGNCIHEIGHTIGLFHEQSREDRDLFIAIEADNLIRGTEHNFRQHISDGDDIGEYDFGSIMHYPLTAFAEDTSKPTIRPLVPVPAGVTIGQRRGLSDGDVEAVKKMYS